MIRGLYAAAAGLSVEVRRNELISNNLANVNTSGYKRDDLVVETFPEMLLSRMNDSSGANRSSGFPARVGSLGVGGVASGESTDFALGGLTETGNPLDLALSGDGFFAVQTPGGERYTRDGSFSRGGDGYLVTSLGQRVLGENGPIQINGKTVEILDDGQVKVDGATVDRLKLVRFPNSGSLAKEGSSLLRSTQPGVAIPATERIVQAGHLERSNVNVVQEMVNMIASMRAYETNQKVIQVHDELLGKAVNEVGRIQ